MASASIAPLAILSLVTGIGILFTYDGYSLANKLLAWTGWIVGASAGAASGWFILPRVSESANQLGATLMLLVVGALLGRLLIPLLSWLTVVLLGFVTSAGAALIFLAGQQLMNRLATLKVNPQSPADLERAFTELTNLPVFQEQQVVLLTLAAGFVGALAASKFYHFIITTAVSSIGAVLLSIATPLWQQALQGGSALGAGLEDLSIGRLLLFLISGLAIQVYRYQEALDLPWTSGDYDPLEGE